MSCGGWPVVISVERSKQRAARIAKKTVLPATPDGWELGLSVTGYYFRFLHKSERGSENDYILFVDRDAVDIQVRDDRICLATMKEQKDFCYRIIQAGQLFHALRHGQENQD